MDPDSLLRKSSENPNVSILCSMLNLIYSSPLGLLFAINSCLFYFKHSMSVIGKWFDEPINMTYEVLGLNSFSVLFLAGAMISMSI